MPNLSQVFLIVHSIILFLISKLNFTSCNSEYLIISFKLCYFVHLLYFITLHIIIQVQNCYMLIRIVHRYSFSLDSFCTVIVIYSGYSAMFLCLISAKIVIITVDLINYSYQPTVVFVALIT
jgi:hypothetical protein